MVYKVPASKASYKQNQFEFEIDYERNGKTKTKKFTVPKMQYLSSDIRERMQRVGASIKTAIDTGAEPSPAEIAEASSIQRELFDKYAPGLYELCSDDQIEAINEAWQEASGISVGESSPSAD